MRTEVMRVSFIPWRWPQRGRRWFVFMAAAATLAVIARLFFPPLEGPTVTRIVVAVTPNPLLRAATVRAAALPAARGGLLAVNLAAVRSRVEALPWVADADVRRVWPGTLAIRVTLEKPIARWGDKALVDASGHVFSPGEASRFAELPELLGPPGSAAELLGDLSRARALLVPRGFAVAKLSANARGDMRLVLEDGLTIELGRDEPLERLSRFVNVAAPALGADLERASSVDMRYPNGFAVAWKENPNGEHHG